MTLPFGHRLAPKIFTAYSDALVWIAQKPGAGQFKYVDDFVSAQPAGLDLCQHDLDVIQATCGLTGFKVQEEKSKGPTTCLSVLGIGVDTVAWELRVIKKKLQALSVELQTWSRRSAASKCKIALLHGQLSFMAQVAKPRRIFLQVKGHQYGQKHLPFCRFPV